MTISDYVKQVVEEFYQGNVEDATEIVPYQTIDFDIGVTPSEAGYVYVDPSSNNRVKFSITVNDRTKE